MAEKVEQSSIVESQGVQTTISVPSSSTFGASSAKVSMFGSKKSGFVIPKNKLSGAMVPIYRGSGKVDASDAVKEESINKVQRKTKWGTDLTQDASVRRGRALAYQTRVEQITKQLKSGAMDIAENQSLESSAEVQNQDSSTGQTDELGKRELLELEKREVIGEILRLNPSYKAPSDYKPLLKEAKVPIPLEAYPGYNFIRLILGPESNTQKRLEEETGAKICVHGTLANTGEKKEVTFSDEDESQATYEDLYVHISAETYEKVDTAVALVELLVTPVTGSLVSVASVSTSGSGDHVAFTDQGQSSAASFIMPVTAGNQGLLQPGTPVPSGPPLVQFQSYTGPWFPQGPPNTLLHPPSGFISPSSVTAPNNTLRFPPSPISPYNPNPFFGVRPSTQAFGLVATNTSLSGQPPMQVLQRPYVPEAQSSNQNPLPQNLPMPGHQSQPVYNAVSSRPSSAIPSFTSNQSMPSGSISATRPSPVLDSVSSAPSGLPPRQVTSTPAAGIPSGWSGVPPNIPLPFRSFPPSVPQSSRPTAQSIIPSSTQSIMPGSVGSRPPAMNAAIPPNFISRPPAPQVSTAPVNQQPMPQAYASNLLVLAPPMPIPSSVPMSAPAMNASNMTPASIALMGSTSRPLSVPMPTPAVPSVFSQSPALVNATSTSILGQAPPPMQSSAAPMQSLMVRGSMPMSSPSQGQMSAPVMAALQAPLLPAPNSVPGSVPSFSPMKAPTTALTNVQPIPAPKPQRPSSSDFTFQPQRPQLPSPLDVLRPTNQAVSQNTAMQPTPVVQFPSAPQAQSPRPTVNNAAPPPPTGLPGFSRQPAANQMAQSQAPMRQPSPNSVASFAGLLPRLPPFPNQRPGMPTTPAPQMRPQSFFPTQAPHPRGPYPGNQLPANRPGLLMVPNQQLGFSAGRPTSSPSSVTQIYDPFSPTSISVPPHQGGHTGRKQETDAEYEDLMASVGVK